MSIRRVSTALAFAAVLLFAACSSDSSTTASSSSSSVTTTSAAATSSSSSSAAATTAASLGTAANAKIGQSILVDGKGMTVYLFANDTGTTSAVPANIAANWPPVTATGTPTAGAGLDASKLTVAPQADGTQQLSYNGHLLYLFVGDKAAGDANGQGLGGIWYVLSASGDKIA
jgi:predicted lipoprotein with Yx(FWY)xxD motif